ncbi:hypothetical protein [Bradyrhizobium lablabi]|uniref:hypothetical protein n=1 Tax=Bradyrhizobium lablabi TaxID=722472 RepID=UPI001BA8014F|nr:hypothetical protein [Bradyrhizobium lablabi]MBR0696107.1 hypothetical protein [Bradyrhizobium lablabi]
MISSTTSAVDRDVARHQERSNAGADRLLSLAAAPTFVLMAVLTGIHDGGAPSMLCSSAHDASPLTGMLAMYLLMSAFHLPPWVRLVRNWRHVDR